jgi:L-threonylcarbamoyladenylate synthase
MHYRNIEQAARVVAAGGIVAYPTEYVFGLGCDPRDSDAVDRILNLKRRSPYLGLILLAASVDQLEPYVDWARVISPEQVSQSWPGPVTWVLPKRPMVPKKLAGSRPGIAVRVTDHPVARRLAASAGPLVSTSANPTGWLPARTVGTAKHYFGKRLDFYLGGAVLRAGDGTEIRDAATGKVFRSGG